MVLMKKDHKHSETDIQNPSTEDSEREALLLVVADLKRILQEALDSLPK